jgi:hypothetical protein
MEGIKESRWKNWLDWVLTGLFLGLLAAGIPIYFLWRVCK